MQKIIPHLWFDKEASEAAALYTSAFEGSRVIDVTTLHNTPSGSVDIVDIELAGQGFTLLNAGPLFKFNPSISFLAACETKEEAEALWSKLSEGGTALMEFGSYPFSSAYGWTQDRYGLSWQIMYTDGKSFRQKITPTLMFVGEQCGKAEEAMSFYASVFPDSKVGQVMRYGSDERPEKEGNVKHASFSLFGQEFAAMESSGDHRFAFNEAISLIVRCETQEEIDEYWDKLSAVPESEQCGWLKDKYGVSWQIVPSEMDEMLTDKDEDRLARVTEAFLAMKKFDIAKLREAAGSARAR